MSGGAGRNGVQLHAKRGHGRSVCALLDSDSHGKHSNAVELEIYNHQPSVVQRENVWRVSGILLTNHITEKAKKRKKIAAI